jgi:hypothetical protein
MEVIFAAAIVWFPLMWIANSLHEIAHSLKPLRGSTRGDIRNLLNLPTPTGGPQV